jgi:ubiquinone/menaquinone biosynthesis C-methylase UbiE
MAEARVAQKDVPQIYNGIAGIYDLWGALTEKRARTRAITLANIQDGENILDVASGTGLILADIVRHNPNGFTAGIDISEGMLQKARGKFQDSPARIEIKLGSAFEIPYPAAKFDLLINGYMFDLMPYEDMPKILAEFRRVLKPDGRLALVNMTTGEKPGSQIYQWIYDRSPEFMGGCRGVRLCDLLTQTGFKVVTREYHQQFFFPSEVILATPD